MTTKVSTCDRCYKPYLQDLGGNGNAVCSKCSEFHDEVVPPVSAKFKPMKPPAGKLEDADLPKLRFPLIGSPKIDGIRGSVQDGQLVSNTLKLIPNRELRLAFSRLEFEGLDGELVEGDPTAVDVFQKTSSVVMSDDKPASNVTWFVFDKFDADLEYSQRMIRACSQLFDLPGRPPMTARIVWVHTKWLHSLAELLDYEAECLEKGYEGIMLRNPKEKYKQGRSTLTTQGLLRRKPRLDAEALILDCYEEMENRNEAVANGIGHMKRSTSQAGKVGKGTLGGFVVRGLTAFEGIQFNIGGFGTVPEMQAEWNKFKAGVDSPVGKILKFNYQAVGNKIKPRQPIAVGYRDVRDVDAGDAQGFEILTNETPDANGLTFTRE